MDRLLERCAGLDVHKKTVTACVRVPGARGVRPQEVRTFGTTTEELLALRDWLTAHAVTHVALERTGVYWKPVYYILEEAVTCVLVNAAHLQHVPGRKTDMQDCVWLTQVLEHGLDRYPAPCANYVLVSSVGHAAVLKPTASRSASRSVTMR